MSNVTVQAPVQATFTSQDFMANAIKHEDHKRLVAAAAVYDSRHAAIAAINEVWDAMEAQIANGAGYTPGAEFGCAGLNAAQIAATVIGQSASVSKVRKALSDMVKAGRRK